MLEEVPEVDSVFKWLTILKNIAIGDTMQKTEPTFLITNFDLIGRCYFLSGSNSSAPELPIDTHLGSCKSKLSQCADARYSIAELA